MKPKDSVTIIPYRDGPLLVRGAVTLLDAEGRPISSQRRVIALCRCGKSRSRPFCDGTHKLVGFRAPGGEEAAGQPGASASASTPASAPGRSDEVPERQHDSR